MTETTAVLLEAAGRIFSHARARPAGGFDAALWDMIAEAGLDRLLLPEDLGGSGDFSDAVAVATLAGARAIGVPLIETMAANWCLAEAGLDVPDGPKSLYAPHRGAAPALDGQGRLSLQEGVEIGWEPVARARVMMAVRDGRPAIALCTEAVAGEDALTIAGEPVRRAASGTVQVSASAAWSARGDLPLALLALLKAAAIAGASETAVALSIEYANLRVQFGRKIGAFQAIQHMIARMAAEAAATAAGAQYAGIAFGQSDGVFAAAVAKGRASEAAGKIAAAAHQVHGAIGFTAEHALHRFTQRLWNWREEAGNEVFWYDRIGQAGFGSAATGLWAGITQGLDVRG